MDERKNKFERLREAFQDVKNKSFAIRKAARVHGIPESTLRGRLKDPKGLDVKVGAPPLFTPKQEEELASYCIKMAHIGYGFSRWQVIDIAANMNKILQRNINPTKHWFYGFLSRYPEIAMINPKKREKARDDAVTEETLRSYFSELTSLLNKYDLVNKPAHIWNVDESGISLDHNPPKVLAQKGTTPHMVTAGHSPTTTVIAAVSAFGETIPPYMIYKGERLSKELTTGGLQGTEYRTSPSGWSNSILFLDFFKNHFLHHVTTRPCILLYDGHTTHVTADMIQTAREENVHLFVLPPHTSHCLQPLDVSVFGPFKKSLSTEFHKFSHEHPNSTITREQLPRLVGRAYVSALTVPNVMSGFRKTGIFPLNASAVDTSAPAITSQPTSTTENRKQRHDNRTIKMLFQDTISKFTTTKSDVPLKKARKRFVPPYGAAITEDSFLQQKEKENMNPKPAKEPVKKSTKPYFRTPFLSQTVNNNKNEETIPETTAAVRSLKHAEGKGKADKVTKNKKSRIPSTDEAGPSHCYVDDSQSDRSDSDMEITEDEKCSVCKNYTPVEVRNSPSVVFVKWVVCDGCGHWVHLKYCTDVTCVRRGSLYFCIHCPADKEE